MTLIRQLVLVSFIGLVGQLFFAQGGSNLTGSPYSSFGLGIQSNTNTGINAGLGRSGIALNTSETINLFNPASFINIENERFILDFGTYSETQNIISDDGEERRFATNFSNIAFAFNGNGNYALGLSLKPQTSVGYVLVGIDTNVEGSNQQFNTNVIGSGGLNEVRLDYARSPLKNLNLGLKLSYLFGSIEETESVIVENSFLSILDDNYYNGLKIGFGLQYQLFNKFDFGLTVDFPTTLNGSRDTMIEKISNGAVSTLENTTGEDIDDFDLPLEVGLGFGARFDNFFIASDFIRSLWSSTNQTDEIGNYVDQTIIALGGEYTIDPNSLDYWKRIRLRTGLNYNSGYLKVNNIRIDDYSASIGLGFPVGKQKGSSINLSYTLGQRGNTNSFLVEENFNTLNINISLSGIWFQKRKYN